MTTEVVVTDHAIERFRARIGSTLTDDQLRIGISELVRPAASVRARRYTYEGVTFCIHYRNALAVVKTIYEGVLPASYKRIKVPRGRVAQHVSAEEWQ